MRKIGEKPPLPRTHSKPGKLHLDYKTHPHFSPKFRGESASYSLENTVSGKENDPNNSFLYPSQGALNIFLVFSG